MTVTFPEAEGRVWDDHSPDSHRHRSLKQSLLLCSVVQTFNGWFSIADATRAWQEEVGGACKRTIRRYLLALEMAGVLEIRKSPRGRRGTRVFEFRWLGWPEPIKPAGTY